jgi:hypothetical protein
LRTFDDNIVVATRDLLRHWYVTWDACKIKCQVTENPIVNVTAREPDVVDLGHAFPARLAASSFLTSMAAGLVRPLAWFFAVKCGVHGFRMAPSEAAVSAVETIDACLSATSLRTEFGEVLRFTNLHDFLGMTGAA